MELLGDIGNVEARFGTFVLALVSAQDRYTVCVECTTGLEIFSGTLNGASR
jgi:hypothetical protein